MSMGHMQIQCCNLVEAFGLRFARESCPLCVRNALQFTTVLRYNISCLVLVLKVIIDWSNISNRSKYMVYGYLNTWCMVI